MTVVVNMEAFLTRLLSCKVVYMSDILQANFNEHLHKAVLYLSDGTTLENVPFVLWDEQISIASLVSRVCGLVLWSMCVPA